MLTIKRSLYPPDDPQHRGPTTGADVIAIKRAISRAGYWKWQEFDGVYSNGFSHGSVYGHGVEGFQRKVFGTGTGKITGNFGQATLTELYSFRIPAGLPNAGERAFDATAIELYQGFHVITPAEEIVKAFWVNAQDLISHEPAVHYAQTRPDYQLFHHIKPPTFPSWHDCSDSVIYLAWLAGALSPDPIFGFSGYGNTGSLIQGGFEISIASLSKYNKNHLVLSFYRNSDHVIAIKSASQAFSHGKEAGPQWVDPRSYRTSDYIQTNAYKVV